MYSLVCVGPGREPERWVSHDAAHILLLFSAGEEIEEVFAEDYDDPTKDADPELETAALVVNGDKKEKEVEEEEEEEDNIMREVS